MREGIKITEEMTEKENRPISMAGVSFRNFHAHVFVFFLGYFKLSGKDFLRSLSKTATNMETRYLLSAHLEEMVKLFYKYIGSS